MEISKSKASKETQGFSAWHALPMVAGVSSLIIAGVSLESDLPDRSDHHLEINTPDIDVCDRPGENSHAGEIQCSEPLAEPEVAVVNFTGDPDLAGYVAGLTYGVMSAVTDRVLEPNHTIIPASEEAMDEYNDMLDGNCLDLDYDNPEDLTSTLAYRTMGDKLDEIDYFITLNPHMPCENTVQGVAYQDYGMADVYGVTQDSLSESAKTAAHEELHLVDVGHSGRMAEVISGAGFYFKNDSIQLDDYLQDSVPDGYHEYDGDSVMGHVVDGLPQLEPELVNCMEHLIAAHNGESPMEVDLSDGPVQFTADDVDYNKFVSLELSEPIEIEIEGGPSDGEKTEFDKFIVVPYFAGINFRFRLALFDSEGCNTLQLTAMEYASTLSETVHIDGRMVRIESSSSANPITIEIVNE